MFPASALHNISDQRLAYTVFACERLLTFASGSISQADRNNVFFRQFGTRIGLACHVICAALRNHVGHIVLMGAYEKMRGIHAQRVVAFVKYPKTIGNRAKVKFPTNAVRQSVAESTIALFCSACPKPTFIGAASINELEEPLAQRSADTPPAHMVVINKASRLSCDLSILRLVPLGNRGLLSAAALAIAVRDFVRGMICHSNSPFLTLLTPPNDSTRCGGNFIGVYLTTV